MGIQEIISSHKEQILALANKYGASDVRVFGSVARGTADERSDIDFLVDLVPGRSLLDLGGFLYELQRLLGRPVDVITAPAYGLVSETAFLRKLFLYERRQGKVA